MVRERGGDAVVLAAGCALAILLGGGAARAGGTAIVNPVSEDGDFMVSVGSVGERREADTRVTIRQNDDGTISVTAGRGTVMSMHGGSDHPDDVPAEGVLDRGGRTYTTGKPVTGRIRVFVYDGEADVRIEGVDVEDLDVEVRDGNARVRVDESRIRGRLSMQGHHGRDSLWVEDSSWGESDVDLGRGRNWTRGVPEGDHRGEPGRTGEPPPGSEEAGEESGDEGETDSDARDAARDARRRMQSQDAQRPRRPPTREEHPHDH